jgi:hypothetical protein
LIYFDGVLQASTNTTSSDSSTSWTVFGEDLHIGRFNGGSPLYGAQGLIDEVAIYDDQLTAAEVLSHYNAGTKGYMKLYRDLVISHSPHAYWGFDENSGTTAYDLSGNSRNGTHTGALTKGGIL